MPCAIWSQTYSVSRRKHHHRCRGCNKILRDGEYVLMARVGKGKTRACHSECADIKMSLHDGEEVTLRDLMQAHSMKHLANLGYPQAVKFVEESPLFCTRPAASHLLEYRP